jgi:hypothetical protein
MCWFSLIHLVISLFIPVFHHISICYFTNTCVSHVHLTSCIVRKITNCHRQKRDRKIKINIRLTRLDCNVNAGNQLDTIDWIEIFNRTTPLENEDKSKDYNEQRQNENATSCDESPPIPNTHTSLPLLSGVICRRSVWVVMKDDTKFWAIYACNGPLSLAEYFFIYF